PSAGPGPHTYSVEISLLHGSPRELVLRTASPADRGNRITDTVMHLDLTDPANLAVAKHLLRSPTPGAFDAILTRMHPVGLVVRAVSEFADTSYSVSGAVKLGIKLAAGYKKITVHKHLISATAEVAGEVRERDDCATAGG